uniref:Uncharacterized protein n=1 Tax=Oryza sativa subsp. japonica TaxID=39947 RepID=Q6YUK9_ORYSJ|nr:hypothetical protein [Oryza sativa Japonica Group]
MPLPSPASPPQGPARPSLRVRRSSSVLRPRSFPAGRCRLSSPSAALPRHLLAASALGENRPFLLSFPPPFARRCALCLGRAGSKPSPCSGRATLWPPDRLGRFRPSVRMDRRWTASVVLVHGGPTSLCRRRVGPACQRRLPFYDVSDDLIL